MHTAVTSDSRPASAVDHAGGPRKRRWTTRLRRPARAASLSGLWYLLSAFAVISYTGNPIYALFAAIDVMLTDASISAVTTAPDHALPRTAELKARLQALCGQLLDRACAAGTVRRDMTQADLIPLMCGVAYAAKAHASGQEPASATGRRYLAVTLDGLRASPSSDAMSRDN